MSKALRISLGLGCAFFVALVSHALGVSPDSSVVGFASALFIWTVMTETEPRVVSSGPGAPNP